MSRRARLASLLCLLSACGNGIGVTDASEGPGPSTGTPATSNPGTSGPTPTSGEPGTGTASGSGGSTSTTTSTTTGVTTGTTTGTTTGVTTGASTGPASTGPASTGEPSTGESGFSCVQVIGDFGACATVLGYGFDGTSCRAYSGCNCGAECEHLTSDPGLCASTCGAAGECNEAAFHAAALAMAPVQVGTFCDEVTACAAAGTEFAQALAQMGVQCEEPGFPCPDGQRCHLQFQGTIDAALWQKMCVASLLPGADLQCVVWGP